MSPTRSAADVLQPGDDVADLAGVERVGARASWARRSRAPRPRSASPAPSPAAARARGTTRRRRGRTRRRRGTGRTTSRRRARAAARRASPAGAGMRSTIASSTSSTPSPVFAEIRSTRSASLADQVGDLGRRAVRVGLRQVDLVHDGDDLEVVLDREVGVRERLRLDPLRGVDDEQRALARLQRARDLVGEVDVARGVDQVELVALPDHAHGLRLDRDPALALEVHRVEHLVAHLAARDACRSARGCGRRASTCRGRCAR